MPSRLRLLVIAVATWAASVALAQDASYLVNESVQHELEAYSDARDYTYRYTEVQRTLSRDGALKSSRTRTYEVVYLYGRQFTRLVNEAGNLETSALLARENRKYEKALAQRARMTEAERQAEDRRLLESSAKRREFIRQIPDLYTFRFRGEEALHGRPSWVIVANPRKDGHPRGFTAANLSHLSGTIWIDKADGRWAKVEAWAPQDINFGLFLARIHSGSRIIFEQVKVNDDVWLPSRAAGMFSARLGLAGVNLESETTYFDYRRFRAESKMIIGGPPQ